GPEPETRTIAQRSGSEPRIDQWRRSPRRGFEEMSSSFAKAASRPAPCIGDHRVGDCKAKHQEFAMDPGRAPQRVFLAHPLNEITQATIDLRAPYPLSGFPAPESFEP